VSEELVSAELESEALVSEKLASEGLESEELIPEKLASEGNDSSGESVLTSVSLLAQPETSEPTKTALQAFEQSG